MRVLFAAALLGLVAACAPTPAPAPQPAPAGVAAPAYADFICDDGRRFSVQFSRDTAIVTPAEGAPLTLTAEPTGSGYAYGDGGRHRLEGKGLEALWTVGRMVPVRCADVTQSK